MNLKMKGPGAPVQGASGTKIKAGELQVQDTEKKLSRQQRWRLRNPEAYLCHLTVQNAIRLGVIHRGPCAVCGNPNAESHHEDYSQPLTVIWLCRAHHKARHARARPA